MGGGGMPLKKTRRIRLLANREYLDNIKKPKKEEIK